MTRTSAPDPNDNRRVIASEVQRTVELYESGRSLAAVARELGITRQGVYYRLQVAGAERRPQLRFGADNHFHRGGRRSSDQAHNKLEKAMERGEIVRPDKCEECGGSKRFRDGRAGIHAHHDDYNKPLEVRWLCQPCHHRWHQNNTAVEATT